jgi:hypothetical protein
VEFDADDVVLRTAIEDNDGDGRLERAESGKYSGGVPGGISRE